MKGHRISGIVPGSIAEEMEIAPGDLLLSVNGHELEDVFDYHYLVNEEYVVVLIRKPDGEQWELEIEKEYDEDLGLVFDQALLDEYHSCRNKCIFCFIDQMPPGMRDTLYFKDDDARLSFLQGNYITLTNMSDKDIDRIIRFHLAPINVSVHTTNPELRCKMLHNRFAGDALDKMKKLAAAGIEMNSQIVLCKGWNDGEELDRTIEDLMELYPSMQSLSVVPMGTTKYREHLVQVDPFDAQDAGAVLDQIHGWQARMMEKYGIHFVHASDEWFIMAGRPLPEAEYYEGYGQIENGVGMVRSFIDEWQDALEEYKQEHGSEKLRKTVSFVTGKLFAPSLENCVRELETVDATFTGQVFAIRNDFFGESITVAGLVTAQDIIAQLSGKDLGAVLLVPDTMLRADEDIFLDDITVEELSQTLQIPVVIVKSNGYSLLEGILG